MVLPCFRHTWSLEYFLVGMANLRAFNITVVFNSANTFKMLDPANFKPRNRVETKY